jgi:hypothetical protein
LSAAFVNSFLALKEWLQPRFRLMFQAAAGAFSRHEYGIAMLEGGGLVSRTLGEPRLYTAAIQRAAAMPQAPRLA